MSQHLDRLMALFPLEGRDVLDVGAGGGGFARLMADAGARVTALEVSTEKVASARVRHGNVLRMLEGRGEALPVDDASQDVVCFMFSFHHVPQEVQEQALAEARRVLRPGGRLHVAEPRPFGSMFEVVRLVDDETEVRTRSQTRLDALGEPRGFRLVAKDEYVLDRVYADFEAWARKSVAVDPKRAARLPEVEVDARAAFEQVGQAGPDGVTLSQPCVAYHFEAV